MARNNHIGWLIGKHLPVLLLLTACTTEPGWKSVQEDFSELGNDFVSNSVKANMRLGGGGAKYVEEDTLRHWNQIGLDIVAAQRFLEQSGGHCVAAEKIVVCRLEKRWKQVTEYEDGTTATESIFAPMLFTLGKDASGHLTLSVQIHYQK